MYLYLFLIIYFFIFPENFGHIFIICISSVLISKLRNYIELFNVAIYKINNFNYLS